VKFDIGEFYKKKKGQQNKNHVQIGQKYRTLYLKIGMVYGCKRHYTAIQTLSAVKVSGY
jgi:hypothetical protein